MKGILPALTGYLISCGCLAQTYPPAAGLPGTTAIHKDSSVFVSWCTASEIKRGPVDISAPSSGFASVGDSSMATGKALTNGVVSLGDGGSAVCTFQYPLSNGTGFDFAVFENSIDDNFLELAFVEVSSDGQNFFRFPSHSLTDTSSQTGSFGTTDPALINNLAGKYRAAYGTPFDLDELRNIQGLDVNRVTHIKITDVVGALSSQYCSRDSKGNKINDPWPTPFPSSGFDLDAIGVIHQDIAAGLADEKKSRGIKFYPNPVNSGDLLQLSGEADLVEILSSDGLKIYSQKGGSAVGTGGIISGFYYLVITTKGTSHTGKLIIRN